jgi:L-asparaginase
LNNYINSARDVRKTNTTNVQTFSSGEKGYLGYIAQGKVFRFNDRLYRQTLPLPEKLPKVALVWDYAGSDGSLVRQAVDEGVKGIVVVAVGAGNVNPQMFEASQFAMKKGVAVVISSRVYYGSVLPIYGDIGGGADLKKAGAILGGNLTPPKARLLLMLALPVVKQDHQKLADYFCPKGLPG